MTFVVKKASAGIDALGILDEQLGDGFEVREFDDRVPLLAQVADANALLTRAIPITAEVIDAAPGLRIIQRPGIHPEGIDIAYAHARGIHVARVPAEARIGVKGVPVAEHALALLLGVTKSLRLAQPSFATGTVGLPTTEQLAGMRLGLVGMGRIGAALVPMARALDLEVAAVRSDPSAPAPDGLAWVGGPEDLERLLAWSQIVSLQLPLTPATQSIIGRAQLAAMPRGRRWSGCWSRWPRSR
jgi:phosphoglycerate dehydrogenase-like enzyme